MQSSKLADLPVTETHRSNGNLMADEPTPGEPPKTNPPEPVSAPWNTFITTAKTSEIKERFAREVSDILNGHGVGDYCSLALLEPVDSIDANDLDQIYAALLELNPDRTKNVLLVLLSRGGSIEPAYQISKLCKSFAKERFVVVVPRHAKSAATLIAIGADEIHIGPLGQLGPIDPQLGGLPALGVSQALRRIAAVSEEFPKSADMLARYLQRALTVEQIGYCDRIPESAVQYAERLLSTKPSLQKKASTIARELVHEYKDHGFVIDVVEAQTHLGDDWIKRDTNELKAAEGIYKLFDNLDWLLDVSKSKRLLVMGGLTVTSGMLILNSRRES
jgi:Serine dehydrogenase proteinase